MSFQLLALIRETVTRHVGFMKILHICCWWAASHRMSASIDQRDSYKACWICEDFEHVVLMDCQSTNALCLQGMSLFVWRLVNQIHYWLPTSSISRTAVADLFITVIALLRNMIVVLCSAECTHVRILLQVNVKMSFVAVQTTLHSCN